MKMIEDWKVDEIFCPHCHVWVKIEELVNWNDQYASLKSCPYCGGTVVYFK